MNDHRYTNALIHEKSPYLLQHAHNPVHWQPWGEAAFRAAREQNKPVLVSIGYATCHWCHVMERESFEDPGLAELLNAHFIAIKVDREERPDVDAVYMQAVHALGRQGGWPLNVFVTPEGEPFYGGTYFPPQPRYGMPSFAQVLQWLVTAWQTDRDKIAKQCATLVEYLRQNAGRESAAEAGPLGFEGEDRAAGLYAGHYDSLNHGFRFQEQNKFPPSMGLSVLLRHHHRTGDAKSLGMTVNTLSAMKHGGIYDQLGGGLARYSTDYQWLVPHFEKMLYDNALFVTACIETHQITGRREFADYARDVLEYIDRDMTSPEGAFYSAEDADSEGVEGKFYVWTLEEIRSLLGHKTASVAVPFYNVSEGGNWEGHNILNVTRPPSALAGEIGVPEPLVSEELGRARRILLEARSKRIRPLLDDKILASWNGLMISALAKSGRVLEDGGYIARAERAAQFILARMRAPDGGLLRRYRDGDARYKGYLYDYASMAVACLDLYEATHRPEYIRQARELMRYVENKFASPCGAFFETADDAENLIVRQISGYDGVEPSGNSNAALAFLKLSALTGETALADKAADIFRVFHDEMMDFGINSPFMMQALHLHLGGMKTVAVVGPRNDPATETLRRFIQREFIPNAVSAFAWSDEADSLAGDIPLLAGRKPANGKATAYVCKHGACLPPVSTPAELRELLKYNI